MFKIYYNAKPVISNIQKPSINLNWSDLLYDKLQTIIGKAFVLERTENDTLPQKEFKFPKQFLQDFHNHVLSTLQTEGIIVENVIQNQWMQKYIFIQGSYTAEIDFYYNGKKQFSRIVPIIPKSTSIELVNKIIELIQIK